MDEYLLLVQVEVGLLKKELADKDSQLSVKPDDKAVDDELSWLNVLSQETSENVQERINLQKALFELDESNLRNRTELQHLDDSILNQQVFILSSTQIIIELDKLEDLPAELDFRYQKVIL